MTEKQRTEAHTLVGRNAKTQWRQEFEGLSDVAARRKAATNRQLIEAYDSFLRAYSSDLNHYPSGLGALQMCHIAISLANEDEKTWEDAFDSEREARAKKEELLHEFDRLQVAVKLAVQEARKRLPAGSDARIWAGIANAELLYLTEAKDERVMRAYQDSDPSKQVTFVLAAKAQLELFSKLDIRTTLADAIIAKLGSSVGDPPPAVVIVAGHRVDELGRTPIRFPERAVVAVRETLREKLAKLKESAGGIGVLSSAAPGTDIICHELCRELGVKSTICMPMAVDSYATNTFRGDLDDWRRRFLALVKREGADSLHLSDAPGLPRWLDGSGMNEWERGNRWVLQLALSAGAPKVSMIAVWDESEIGNPKGGTAHMVKIAAPPGP